MNLYCVNCGYMPAYDEWASKTTCIDFFPLNANTDSSQEIKESVTKGEKDIPIPLL